MNDSDATRSPCDTAAALVHQLYIEELKRALMPPVHPMVNGEQTQALIRSARGMGPATCEEPDETTWIWSDLHLGHEMSLAVFDRSFRTAHEADRTMMNAWRDLVDVDDTIVCLGDIGVDGSVDETQAAQWNHAPGIKWLVVGNHDVDPLNPLNALVIDRTEATLAAPGNPSLVLTHVPLRRVPAGWVNVHGHIHQERSPTDERHINVSVEQLDYRPARMSDIRRLARRLVKGTSVPGETTRARLDLVEHVMAQH
jgi:calcineurin-like phosphoesterase family protein